MADSQTQNKALYTPAHNADIDSWDVPLNANAVNTDAAFGGSYIFNAAGLSGTQTLNVSQYVPLGFIIQGAPAGNINFQVPSGVGGLWAVRNQTTGTSITIGFGSGAGGGYISIPQGKNVPVTCDGSALGMVSILTATGAAAGSNTQVQYNSSGNLAASASLTFDGTTLAATGLNVAGNTTLGSGAGSTLTINGTAVSFPNGLSVNSGQFQINTSTGAIGIGIAPGSSLLTVGGTIQSTSGGFTFPDGTVQTTAGNKTGVCEWFAGPTANVPSSALLCYGQAVSRTTYANLYNAIGTLWGSGDGSTTFNVPDLRGRSLFGLDNMGGTAANRITAGVSGINGATVGATGGSQQTLSGTETSDYGNVGSGGIVVAAAPHQHYVVTMPPAAIGCWIIWT